MKSPGIDLHRYTQLISDRGAKVIEWSKENLATNDAEATEQPQAQNKSRHLPYTLHKK